MNERSFARSSLLHLAVILSLVALGLAACSSDSGEPANGSRDAGGTISCRDDARGAQFVPNLEREGTTYKFVLVSADPAPPHQGKNQWVVRVLDRAGEPVPNANLAVDPFMPDHGHGSAFPTKITDNGDGSYALGDVVLSMAGLWDTTMTVAPAGGPTDSAVFSFCVGE